MSKVVTIEELENYPIYGNHYHDSKLFQLCHSFILSNSPTDEKIRALKVIGKAMGSEEVEIDEKDVENYIKETSKDGF